MTTNPHEVAAAIGGEVFQVYEPLRIACPTCEAPPGRKCHKLYDGTEAHAHPRRREGGRGVRVVGPFVRLMHYMPGDHIAAVCGSPGDPEGLRTTNIPSYVTCPDCQATLTSTLLT